MAGSVNVRLFGTLHSLRRQRGLPTVVEVIVPGDGTTGEQIARDLGLPLHLIEGLFCNHTVYPIGHRIMPGDEVAFVPLGTPGPHRFFLGLYQVGREPVDDSPYKG